MMLMKKYILLLTSLLLVVSFLLSGCGEPTPPETIPTGINGKTNEPLTDFDYLFTRQIYNDKAAIKAQSLDDIVTALVTETDGDMYEL